MKLFRKIAALLGFLLLVFPAWGTEYNYREGLDSFLQESRTGELMDKVPEGAGDFLNDLSPRGMADMVDSFTPQTFLGKVWNSFQENLRAPMRLLVSLAGVLVLCALLDSFGSSFSSGSVETVFGVVVTVFISSIIINPLVGCIVEAREVIRDFGTFILAFIPAFAGVVTASGDRKSVV